MLQYNPPLPHLSKEMIIYHYSYNNNKHNNQFNNKLAPNTLHLIS